MLAACGGSAGNNQNQTTSSAFQSIKAANIDPSTIGFAANFAGQHAELQIAFGHIMNQIINIVQV